MLRLSLGNRGNDNLISLRALHVSQIDRTKRFNVLVFFVIFALLGYSSSESAPLDAQLDAILKRELPPETAISIKIVDFTSGKTLMENHSDTPLIPASALKIVTTAAALQVLNPEFRFNTEVYVEAARNGAVDNCYLKGYGDPHLVSEELFRLTSELKNRGLHRIRGNIVVDDSFFCPAKPVDEQEKLGSRAYHAPYGALSLNFNAVKLTVVPSSSSEHAELILDPNSEYAQVQGRVKNVKGNKPLQIEIEKKLLPDEREIFQVEGTIGASAPIKGRYINVASPSLYTGHVFKEFLLREGIRVDGKVIRGVTPETAMLFLEFPSLPLGTLVYWLNKHSNNFMAEQINMALGAQVHGAPGTREKGLAVLKKHLENCGVDESAFNLVEASGLSRNNRISAAAMVKVLMHGAYDFAYNAEYLASFGIAGTDGTLKEKFTDSGARRRLRAKTGTLRGVNALAGFGVSVDNKPFAFAILANSTQKNPGPIDSADKIMRAILEVPMKR